MRVFQRTWTPFQDFRVQTSLDRLSPTWPAINLWGNKDTLVLTADLPGVEREKLDISIEGDRLTLQGGREASVADQEDRSRRRERTVGHFVREIQLPYAVQAEQVEATLRNGVLQLRLPRAEADKPKRVAIQAA